MMPTSATGRSNNARGRRPFAARASGFTLLELLVVIVIIGIVTSMAVVSIHVLGGDHEMDQEAARLQAILMQAREDAMLQGRDVGMRIDPRGYDFLYYDGRTANWTIIQDDPLLRERTFPDGLSAGLMLESRQVQLKPRVAPTPLQPALPQVVVQASGDLAPFDIVLARDGTEERRRLAGTAEGKFEVHDDAREQAR